MKKISLITVYNNDKLLGEMVKSASEQKNVEIDFVSVVNKNNEFSSAAKALNYGFEKSVGEVVVFLHQDIQFMKNDVLEYIYDYAMKNKNVIFGSAGVQDRNKYKNPECLSSMLEGENKSKYNTITEPTDAFTLDECLIACHRSCFDNIKFDEELCDGWHLYAADLCLQAQAFANLKVKAVPLDVWHKSTGNADRSYHITQSKMAEKYRKYYKVVNTTNGYSYTNPLKNCILNIYRKFRYGGSA